MSVIIDTSLSISLSDVSADETCSTVVTDSAWLDFTAIETLSRNIETVSQVTEDLANESNNIGSVLDVIRSISEQTNLLALNAAIEAARAGEHGRVKTAR